jgi:hypothetical protein
MLKCWHLCFSDFFIFFSFLIISGNGSSLACKFPESSWRFPDHGGRGPKDTAANKQV